MKVRVLSGQLVFSDPSSITKHWRRETAQQAEDGQIQFPNGDDGLGIVIDIPNGDYEAELSTNKDGSIVIKLS